MVKSSACLLLGAMSAIVSAAPAAAPELAKRSGSCTFSGSTGAALAIKSKTSCSTIILSSLVVPAGTTLDLTGLNKGTNVIFEGITTFGYELWSGPFISVSGTDITVSQTSGGYFDGGGASYWDGLGANGGKTKPKFFFAHGMINSNINNIYIKNPPLMSFSIDNANNLTISSPTIDASAGDAGSQGHNTDGFDIGSSNLVTITGAKVYNQDDCVAINSGTNIIFSGGYCSGGHGLSIGSVGGRADNVVENVQFENSAIKNSQNGIRLKSFSGATGTISGITYSGITLSGVTEYGIVVNQAYGGQTNQPTNGVSISNFILNGVTGSIASTATRIAIECGSGSCSNWTWSGVTFTGGVAYSNCTNVPTSGGAHC